MRKLTRAVMTSVNPHNKQFDLYPLSKKGRAGIKFV